MGSYRLISNGSYVRLASFLKRKEALLGLLTSKPLSIRQILDENPSLGSRESLLKQVASLEREGKVLVKRSINPFETSVRRLT